MVEGASLLETAFSLLSFSTTPKPLLLTTFHSALPSLAPAASSPWRFSPPSAISFSMLRMSPLLKSLFLPFVTFDLRGERISAQGFQTFPPFPPSVLSFRLFLFSFFEVVFEQPRSEPSSPKRLSCVCLLLSSRGFWRKIRNACPTPPFPSLEPALPFPVPPPPPFLTSPRRSLLTASSCRWCRLTGRRSLAFGLLLPPCSLFSSCHREVFVLNTCGGLFRWTVFCAP